MEIKIDQQKRAERMGLISLIIGICIIPVWLLAILISSYADGFSMLLVIAVMYAPVLVALAGLVLGVVGLAKSARTASRTKKGVVLSSIGVVLNLLALCAAACFCIYMYALGEFPKTYA